MPVIPLTKGTKPSQPAQPMPTETELMMALAEMHKQGKLTQPKEAK